MGSAKLGAKRQFMSPHRIYVDRDTLSCGSFFLDSGAHSLYNAHVFGKRTKEARYAYYATKDFWAYVDRYAAFVKKYRKGLDWYANVDVIYNPELSWKVLKYLEGEHGLSPVPVIHRGTPLAWVEKHLAAGYGFVGLGGLGQESTKQGYTLWADEVFDMVCSGPGRVPAVKLHGFAMTSYDLMIRYPWYSVDSASWAKSAGFGSIFVPHKRNGKFTFGVPPYVIGMSWRSTAKKDKGRHYSTLTKGERKIVREWLEEIKVPLGKIGKDGKPIKDGVFSQYNPRALANGLFFQRMCEWLPKWPWAFSVKPRQGFFSAGG